MAKRVKPPKHWRDQHFASDGADKLDRGQEDLKQLHIGFFLFGCLLPKYGRLRWPYLSFKNMNWDLFFMGLGVVSVIALIVAYFLEDPIHVDRIHENLKELKIKPLRKGEKCTYFMRIKDVKGRDKSYALTDDSFYFFVAHLSPTCEAFADYMLALWQQEPFKLILQPTLGETKQTETLGLWQFDGQRHTISLAT